MIYIHVFLNIFVAQWRYMASYLYNGKPYLERWSLSWDGAQKNMGNIDQYPLSTSNIIRTLVGNKIVDHSHVVGASPVALL